MPFKEYDSRCLGGDIIVAVPGKDRAVCNADDTFCDLSCANDCTASWYGAVRKRSSNSCASAFWASRASNLRLSIGNGASPGSRSYWHSSSRALQLLQAGRAPLHYAKISHLNSAQSAWVAPTLVLRRRHALHATTVSSRFLNDGRPLRPEPAPVAVTDFLGDMLRWRQDKRCVSVSYAGRMASHGPGYR